MSPNTVKNYIQTYCDLFVSVDEEASCPLPVAFLERVADECFFRVHGTRFAQDMSANAFSRALQSVDLWSASGAGPAKPRIERFGKNQMQTVTNIRLHPYADLRASRPSITFEVPETDTLHKIDPYSHDFGFELRVRPTEYLDWKPILRSTTLLNRRKSVLEFLYQKYLSENPNEPKNPKTYTAFLDRERVYPYIDFLHEKGAIFVPEAILPKP